MSWISYAQNGEDVRLRRAFLDRPTGFWVDVGACDPVDLSITKHFYDAGWHGLNIDASPQAIERFKRVRPRDTNLNIGVSNRRDRLPFWRATGDSHGNDTSGLSTFVREEVDIHEKAGFRFERIDVDVAPLTEILAQHVHGTIDFLSVDVEGYEREVLEGAELSRWQPRAIVVEATRPLSTEQTHARWESFILEAGYQFVVHDGLNRWYVREKDTELFDKIQLAPNVFDDYVPWRFEQELQQLRQRAKDTSTPLRLALSWARKAVRYPSRLRQGR